MRKIVINLSVLLVSVCLTASPVFASEGGGASGFVFGVVNFIIFLIVLPVVLKILLGINVTSFFKERGEKVSADYNDASRIKGDAEKMHDSIKTKLDNIIKEIEEIAAEARKRGEHIKNELLENARKRSENVTIEGELMAEREAVEAENYLKKSLLLLSAELAEKKIKKQLDKKKHEKLIDNCIKQLEGM